MNKQKPNTYNTEELSSLILGSPASASPAELKKILMNYYGISYTQSKRIYKKYVQPLLKGIPQVVEPKVKVRDNVHNKTVDASVTVDKAVELDDVIKLCKIDLAKFSVKSFAVEERANGTFVWTVRCHKTSQVGENVVNNLLEGFIESANSHSPKTWTIKPLSKESDCLYVLNLQDVHIAKLANAVETGDANWDIKIAEKAYREAVDDLMGKVPTNRVEEVLIIIGSDLLQVDNDKSTTTAGTYVDSDTRLSKAFDVTVKMIAEITEKLASRFKVRLVSIPGNHDATVSLFVAYYLSAWFKNHPNVFVDHSPKSRKYYGYGKTLIAFDHGNEAKLADLPLIVMRENQDTISQYTSTEVLCGHTHAEFSKDTKGIVVRVAPALCSPDRWHATRGYIGSMRRSQGLLYQKENGLEAIYYSKALN